MIYVTPAKLRRSYGTPELLQASGSHDPGHLVTVELLDLRIDGAALPPMPPATATALEAIYSNIAQSCTDADSRINAAVASRWPMATLPLDPVPKNVERIALWIARYVLRDHVLDEETNTVFRRYREATEELNAFVRGQGTLGIDLSSGLSGHAPVVVAPAAVFTDSVIGAMP